MLFETLVLNQTVRLVPTVGLPLISVKFKVVPATAAVAVWSPVDEVM